MSRHDRSARSGSDRANLYDEITGKIIAELEAARLNRSTGASLICQATVTDAAERCLAEARSLELVNAHQGRVIRLHVLNIT